MKRFTAIIIIGLMTLSPLCAEEAKDVKHILKAAKETSLQETVNLYKSSVNTKNKLGKDLIINIKEITRKPKTSLVNVKFISGSSVASSMFICKGMYEIAKSRKMKYFINLKEWETKDGSRNYIVGFCNEKKVDILKFFNVDSDKGADLMFLSTKQFDMLFRPANSQHKNGDK